MSNEIKEILDDLRTYKDRYEYFLFNNLSFSDRDYKAKQLLDYITNLQEEVNKLTAESTEWESKCYDLQEENERLNNIINELEKFFKYEFDNEVRPLGSYKVSVWTICLDKLKELKGE